MLEAAEVVALVAAVAVVTADIEGVGVAELDVVASVWFKPAFAFESEPPQPEAVAQQHSAMLATAMI